jgi:signal transduction histidine kinase
MDSMSFASDQNLHADGLSDKSRRILAMREDVFAEWERRVRQEVKGAATLLRPILINTLPVFYDNIAQSLTPEYPRDVATSSNTIATAHGGERARMTSYGVEQVIHEYQLFREALAVNAERNAIDFNHADWRIINASLDAAVRESVRQFTEMHEGFRHQVAASLTHDMRTPLSVISNGALVLTLDVGKDKIRDMAQRILNGVRRLDEMTIELLDILSFHRGQKLPLSLTEFDLLPLTEDVAAQASVGQPGRCVVIGEVLHGYWCENSLRRALENLVVNAIKYGSDEPVTIKFGATGGRLMLSVHNAGNAIPGSRVGRIFDYLRRDNDTDVAGWGIGLPFVQNVAESHGGSVAVDSAAETGTTFMIDIPVDCRPFVD